MGINRIFIHLLSHSLIHSFIHSVLKVFQAPGLRLDLQPTFTELQNPISKEPLGISPQAQSQHTPNSTLLPPCASPPYLR